MLIFSLPFFTWISWGVTLSEWALYLYSLVALPSTTPSTSSHQPSTSKTPKRALKNKEVSSSNKKRRLVGDIKSAYPEEWEVVESWMRKRSYLINAGTFQNAWNEWAEAGLLKKVLKEGLLNHESFFNKAKKVSGKERKKMLEANHSSVKFVKV